MRADKAEWEDDTFFGMDWSYLLNVLHKQDFEKVYAHDFKEPGRNNTEEFNLWVRRDKGYLVSADSYHEKSNSVHLYYELALPDSYENLTERQHEFIWKLGGSRNALIINGAIAPSLFYRFDAREGLVRELQKVEGSTLSTNVPWKCVFPREFPFLQLYDFADAKVKEAEDSLENLSIKNKRTLDKLPKDVQEMLGWLA